MTSCLCVSRGGEWRDSVSPCGPQDTARMGAESTGLGACPGSLLNCPGQGASGSGSQTSGWLSHQRPRCQERRTLSYGGQPPCPRHKSGPRDHLWTPGTGADEPSLREHEECRGPGSPPLLRDRPSSPGSQQVPRKKEGTGEWEALEGCGNQHPGCASTPVSALSKFHPPGGLRDHCCLPARPPMTLVSRRAMCLTETAPGGSASLPTSPGR